MDRASNYHLLLPANYKERGFETLKPFNFKSIIWTPPKVNYKIDELLLPSNVPSSSNFSPDDVKKLQSIYLNYKEKEQHNFGDKPVYEKILISRSRSKTRKILNESDLVNSLSQLGFKVLCLEDFSLWEQVHIFNNAKIVIGTHGAGLANILFMRPGTAVYELFPRSTYNGSLRPNYYRIASILGLHYYYQFCESVSKEGETNPYNDNLNVDMDEFFTNVDSIIKKAAL
jgi:capsular polysaccharide biosynthesis protein